MSKLRVIELFAGIGSQTEALKRAGIEHEVVAISEFNPSPSRAYELLHGEVNNMGDVRKIEVLPECDLLTYSFPCTDLSNQGKGKGMEEGADTESSLIWEVERLLRAYTENNLPLPEILLMENVKGIINRHHIKEFKVWIDALSEIGYTSSYQMIRGRDYGFPQERERIYMVSSLTKGVFKFPPYTESYGCMADYLDDEVDVDESLYISEEWIRTIDFDRYTESVRDKDGICRVGKGAGKFHTDTLVYDPSGISPTILAGGSKPMIVMNYTEVMDDNAIPIVRRLTDRECWKLMGFKEEGFDTLSDEFTSRRIKYMAGNSIIVDVLVTIFKGIYVDESFYQRASLMDYGGDDE